MFFSSLFHGTIYIVLVHFTTALLPVSFFSDVVGKLTDRYSLTPAAWWSCFMARSPPLTALAGWMWATDIEINRRRRIDVDNARMVE
jgi:uncharacterized membrane protein